MDNVENSQIPNNQSEENNETTTKQKRVINEVEDRKAIDEGKQKGDKQFQIDAKQAIREYSNTYELIKEIKSSYEGDKTSDFYKFVLEYEIKVISNLALSNKKLNNWEKSIEYDLLVNIINIRLSMNLTNILTKVMLERFQTIIIWDNLKRH